MRSDGWLIAPANPDLVFDRQGTLYFGIGSATNAGVVSSGDRVNQKWLEKRPQVYDVPCKDIVLTGQAFTDSNETTDAAGDEATTGAYVPFGTVTKRGK